MRILCHCRSTPNGRESPLPFEKFFFFEQQSLMCAVLRDPSVPPPPSMVNLSYPILSISPDLQLFELLTRHLSRYILL